MPDKCNMHNFHTSCAGWGLGWGVTLLPGGNIQVCCETVSMRITSMAKSAPLRKNLNTSQEHSTCSKRKRA
jgi:hypothetical protein